MPDFEKKGGNQKITLWVILLRENDILYICRTFSKRTILNLKKYVSDFELKILQLQRVRF